MEEPGGVTRTVGSAPCVDSTAMASLSGRSRCLQVFAGVTEPEQDPEEPPGDHK